MSKRFFLESTQAFSERKPFKHDIKPCVSLCLPHTNTHTQSLPVLITPYIHYPLCALTFTTSISARDLSYFSFPIFPYAVPAVLLAPAGSSSFFFSPRLKKNYSKVSSSCSCTDSLTCTRWFSAVGQTEAKQAKTFLW